MAQEAQAPHAQPTGAGLPTLWHGKLPLHTCEGECAPTLAPAPPQVVAHVTDAGPAHNKRASYPCASDTAMPNGVWHNSLASCVMGLFFWFLFYWLILYAGPWGEPHKIIMRARERKADSRVDPGQGAAKKRKALTIGSVVSTAAALTVALLGVPWIRRTKHRRAVKNANSQAQALLDAAHVEAVLALEVRPCPEV